MVGYEITKTIGNASATYKFTPKYVLKAGLKVMVRAVCLLPRLRCFIVTRCDVVVVRLCSLDLGI